MMSGTTRSRLRPRFLGLVSALVSVSVLSAPAAWGRITVIGIDGGSWNVIDAMWQARELPNLAALAKRGVTADFTTVKPLNSPTVWTSIATGRKPRAHGVTDFQATRITIRVPTLFERLALLGFRVGLYGYLVTWPPAALPDGFVIPGWLRHDDRVSPPDAWDQIDLSPWVMAYEDDLEREDLLRLSQVEFARKAARWNQLAAAFDLDVGAVVFDSVDTVSHRFWNAAFPEDFRPKHRLPEPAPKEHRTAIHEAVRRMDLAVGEITSALGPEDPVIIVSDHGFQAAGGGASNVWVPQLSAALARADLDPARDGFHVITRFGIVIIEVHEGPFEEREKTLERLVAELASWRSSDGERLFDTNVIEAAARPAGQRMSVFRRLKQWGIKFVMQHLYKMNADRPGHAYIFARPRDDVLSDLWPNGRIEAGGKQLEIDEAYYRDSFSGEHDPVGIFIAAGGPIARRAQRARLSVVDVAPLIFYLAGAAIPDDLEGKLPSRILDAEYLATHPPRKVAADTLAEFPPILEAVDPVEDRELLEKLRRLGYVR